MDAPGKMAQTAPTLAHLRAFCAVVEQGGFGVAAATLDTTQPAVSLHVRALERHYGILLLQRLPRGVRLTEAGQVVYARARAMLRGLSAMDAEVAVLRGLSGGRLALGASTTVANYVLPSLIGAFKTRHPELSITLEVENTEIIASHVAAQTLAIGFLEGPMPPAYAATLQVAPFRTDDLVLVVPGTGLLAKHAAVSLDELSQLPFLMREPGSGTRAVLEQALREAGATVQVFLELGHTEAIKTAVALGLGVSILSRQAVLHECHSGELRALTVQGLRLRRTYTAITPRHMRLAPAEQAFLSFVGVAAEDAVAPAAAEGAPSHAKANRSGRSDTEAIEP